VLDVDADFETLPPAAAEDLGLFVDGLSPASFPVEWLPDEVPDLLRKYAGPTFTVGLPGTEPSSERPRLTRRPCSSSTALRGLPTTSSRS